MYIRIQALLVCMLPRNYSTLKAQSLSYRNVLDDTDGYNNTEKHAEKYDATYNRLMQPTRSITMQTMLSIC